MQQGKEKSSLHVNHYTLEQIYVMWNAISSCLHSEETTQLRRMATWEKGPTTEPRTRDLRPNAEFQPREARNRSRSFVPHRPLCATPFSHVAILLSCVVSSEFKQLVPAHKEHIRHKFLSTIESAIIYVSTLFYILQSSNIQFHRHTWQ